MTTSEGQTTTPSGADVLKQHLAAAEKLHGFLAKMIAENRLTEADIPGEHYSVVTAIDVFALTKGFANSEIAALIARNAEFVELRAALVAEVLTADAKADALAAENKALREALNDCAKHMVWQTPQGRAACERAQTLAKDDAS